MNTLRISGIFFLLAFTFHSCMQPLTEKDNGRTIELSDESSFTINLNAEAGMVWKLVGYNEGLIKPQQTEINETTDDSGKPAKEFSFTFNTHGSGESIVSLVCLKENDNTGFLIKTYEVKVICGTMGQIESD